MINKSTILLPIVPKINNLSDLSDQIRLSEQLLFQMSTRTKYYYNVVVIPKDNGESRLLACPSKALKAAQSWILNNILYTLNASLHPTACAYIKGKKILDNVEPHKLNKHFLIMDIEDFFGSIPYSHVWSLFHSLGYNKHVSHILTSLCTYNGSLPQGGVTSPALSNITCIKLDRRLSGLASRCNLIYTRYSDDITLSSKRSNIWNHIQKKVTTILNDEGFQVNPKKTRIYGPATQKRITGLTISDEHLVGIGRRKYNELRSLVHRMYFPKDDEQNDVEKYKKRLSGWLSYLHCIDYTHYLQLRQYQQKMEQKYNKLLEEVAPTTEN